MRKKIKLILISMSLAVLLGFIGYIVQINYKDAFVEELANGKSNNALKKVQVEKVYHGEENEKNLSRNLKIIEGFIDKKVENKEVPEVKSIQEQESPRKEEEFKNIQKADPTILVDLKYATANNFTGEVIYDFTQAIARKGTVEKIVVANSILREQGYALKIWDAYRPTYAQQRLWDINPDPNFVAKPNPNRSHELGVSLDVTLCDINGNELPMQSEFDDFSEKAHRNYPRTEEQEIYYEVLNNAMVQAGFSGYVNEWWHYDDLNKEDYEAMQVNPKEY